MNASSVVDLRNNIKYYENYKTQLNQFLIRNCSHETNSKLFDRTRLNKHELLGILKEISRLEKFIYDLKLIKNPSVSVFKQAFYKHF